MRITFSIVFLIGSFLASAQKGSFFEGFPDYFDYEFRPGVCSIWKDSSATYKLVDEKAEMTLGCRDPQKVKIAFSLLFRQPFLHETYPKYYNKLEQQSISSNPTFYILYGLEKNDSLDRAKTLTALGEYCIYGQINFVHENDDYLLFMMPYAVNSAGLMENLNKLGMRAELLNSIDRALLKELPKERVLGYRHDEFKDQYAIEHFSGAYIMLGREAQDLAYSEAKEKASPRKLSISTYSKSGRGKGKVISNYNQKRGNWHLDDVQIWVDKNLLFLEVEGWGLKAYRVQKNGSLLNLEHGYRYIRIPES